jgi:hypothetical protein
MSFLQRVITAVFAAPASGGAAPPVRGGPMTLGQYLHRRRPSLAGPSFREMTGPSLAPVELAPAAVPELNWNWPEARTDPAPPAPSSTDVGRFSATSRQAMSDPREVAVKSEQGAASGRSRLRESLEVARLFEGIQSGSSAERAERSVSDTVAKDVSETGTAGKAVPADPPSLRPAASFSPRAARFALQGAAQSSATASPDGDASAVAPGTASPALPAPLAAASAPAAGEVAFGPSHSGRDARDARVDEVGTTDDGRASADIAAAAQAVPATFASPLHSRPPVAPDLAQFRHAKADHPPFPAGETRLAPRSPINFREAKVTAPAPGPRHEPAPEPLVQIGNIEVIIEAPAEPRAPSRAPAATPSIASRYYLRGL